MSGQSINRTGANAYSTQTFASRNNAGSASGIVNTASAVWGFPTGLGVLEPISPLNRQITVPADAGPPPPDTSLPHRSRLIYRIALCLPFLTGL